METRVIDDVRLYSGADFRKGKVWIKGGRILAADYGDGARPHGGGADLRLSARGGYVLPAFVDAHFHLTSLALKTLRCDLSSAVSAEEVAARLKTWAGETGGTCLVGVDWDESRWRVPVLPTRTMLDDVDPERPVLARRVCGHVGVANTALLSRLSTVADLVDEESGLIREHALWEAGRLCGPSSGELAGAMEGAIQALHRLGVATIHDIVEPSRFEAYVQGLAGSGAPLRIDILLHTTPEEIDTYRDRLVAAGGADVRIVGVKCFLDGSLGAQTAAVNEPYNDIGGHGTLLVERDELIAIARGCIERGLVCAMHAIGDRAIDQALGVIEAFPDDRESFRIEHCEMVGSAQLDRLAAAPVVLSLQPNFVRRWAAPGGLYERRLGRDRLLRCNPFQTFLSSGIEFIFGSDGMPAGPLYGLKGATEHPVPGERLSASEAIDRYTLRAHRIGPHLREAGTINPGQIADLVILDGDPLRSDVDHIGVTHTILDGQVMCGEGFEAP